MSGNEFVVDLRKLETKNGEFPCPKCGVIISPDDESEEIYDSLEAVMKGTQLVAIILKCKRCGSKIRLTGFEDIRE
jgi:hypothetical protein